MSLPSRFTAPVIGLLLSAILVACGTQAVPTTTPPASVAPAATDSSVARDTYSTAICPVFTALVAMDPRLAAMREAGAGGGDVSAHDVEVDALSDELLGLLNELEELPEWAPGASLRLQLINGLHAVRAQLLRAQGDLAASGAAEALAAIPYLANEALDRAMQEAAQGGLACGDGS